MYVYISAFRKYSAKSKMICMLAAQTEFYKYFTIYLQLLWSIKSSSRISRSILIKWIWSFCAVGVAKVLAYVIHCQVSSIRWDENLQATSWHSFPWNNLGFLDFSPKEIRGLNRISITVASSEAHVGHDSLFWHILKTNHLDITLLYKSSHGGSLINVSVA